MKLRVQILLSLGIFLLLLGVQYVGKDHSPESNKKPAVFNSRVKSSNSDGPGLNDPTAGSLPGVFRTFEISPGVIETWVDGACATYFREDRSVFVNSDPIQVEGSPRNGIMLMPTFEVKSNIVTKPKKITFLVESSREKLAGKTFLILADGQTLISSPLVFVDSQSDDYVETTQVDVPYTALEELSRASRVDIKTGDKETMLSPLEIRRFGGITKIVDSKLKF